MGWRLLMIFRHAATDDLDRIEEIYERIHDYEEQGKLSIGWARGVYPVRQTAADAIARGDIFVLEDNGVITASAIINHIQPDSYIEGKWEFMVPDEEIMVLHTLTVDPLLAGKGYGRRMMEFAEKEAKDTGFKVFRIDTYAGNGPARKMYESLGFRYAGKLETLFMGKIPEELIFFEKKL